MTVVEICESLRESIKYSQKLRHSRKEWTNTIKKNLTQHARKDGLFICTSGVKEADCGEWLYDLVVLKYRKDAELIESAVLALESEWDSDEQSILEDFQKLLLSNAEIKVMLYFKNHLMQEKMQKMIVHYSRSSGIFILAHLPAENSELDIVTVSGNVA